MAETMVTDTDYKMVKFTGNANAMPSSLRKAEVRRLFAVADRAWAAEQNYKLLRALASVAEG